MREDDTVWIPAVPLPYFGWRRVRCVSCGQRFGRWWVRPRNALAYANWAYELHWRRVHEQDERDLAAASGPMTQMAVTRAEARCIYAEALGT